MIDENSIPIVSDSDKASFYNKYFQKMFSKDYEDKNFKLIDKSCDEMKNLFINNDDILSQLIV